MMMLAMVLPLLVAFVCSSARAFTQTSEEALRAADPNGQRVDWTMMELSALSGDVTLRWALNSDEERIYFALEARTTGWAAIGLGEAAGMRGADIAVVHVDSAGKPHVTDFHAIGNQKPRVDGRFECFFSSSHICFSISDTLNKMPYTLI